MIVEEYDGKMVRSRRSEYSCGEEYRKVATIIGYARPTLRRLDDEKLKTTGTDLESQIAELKREGATQIFSETALTQGADRPELRRALDTLADGDTLIVISLDRLARTPTELFYICEEIAKRGAILRSLREQLVLRSGGSTKSGPKDEAPSASSEDDSFMNHLGMILDFERAILREWQHETINAAKRRHERGPSQWRKD